MWEEKCKVNQQLHRLTITAIKFDRVKSNTDISVVRMIRYDYIPEAAQAKF